MCDIFDAHFACHAADAPQHKWRRYIFLAFFSFGGRFSITNSDTAPTTHIYIYIDAKKSKSLECYMSYIDKIQVCFMFKKKHVACYVSVPRETGLAKCLLRPLRHINCAADGTWRIKSTTQTPLVCRILLSSDSLARKADGLSKMVQGANNVWVEKWVCYVCAQGISDEWTAHIVWDADVICWELFFLLNKIISIIVSSITNT